MKALIKGLFVVLLVMTSSAVALAGDEAIPDEPLPPEVQRLIGMKIKTKLEDAIPNFIRNSGLMLNKQLGLEGSGENLVYQEGMLNEKWPVLIMNARRKNHVTEILDIRLLPRELLSWRYENGKINRLDAGYVFSSVCHFGDGDGRIILGLVEPLYERDGYSSRVERAWEISQQNGHMKSIPTQGVICAILGE